MDVPEGLRYTEEHEWLRVEGDEAVVGITAYAAAELGDIVFVELPTVGTELSARQTFGVVESVKAVSDLYSPTTGAVTEVNEALSSRPELVNTDPYGEGWMLRIRVADTGDVERLRDAASYCELIGVA